MPPAAVDTVSRVEVQRSRQLIRESQALIALARELIRQSRWAIRRQTYLKIVCAWCQQTIHWQHAERVARGQISHSICYACFAHVFGELEPGTTPPPMSTQATAGDHPGHTLSLREEARRAGATDPMTDRAGHRGRLALPADAPLTPRTLHEVKALP